MSLSLTAEQARAVGARGKVIVSASAGSGKTFVMIERLVSLILEGADVRRMLAVTFTNKAAAQMKDKLRSALLKKMQNCSEGERERLKDQLFALPQADISTIHAFCARLVRANFFLAEVDPAFRIISPEDAEGQQLSSRAMDETFEEAYEERSEKFMQLLSAYFYKKKDARLREIVRSLYAEVRKSADYREKLLSAGEDLFEKVCGELEREFLSRAEFFRSSALGEREFFWERIPKAQLVCEDIIKAADALKSACGLFGMAALPSPAIASMPSSKKYSGEELRHLELTRALSKGIKEFYKEIQKLSSCEEERTRYLDAQSLSKGLASLVLRYDEIYSRLKKEAGALDYDDLEHCALGILGNPSARETVREKYDHIFVDEYQDVNPAQEKLLNLLDGKDVFLVGDAKQSIYGFRGSKSEYFLQKEREFPETLALTENFRSSAAVLEAVNRVFSRAMTAETCGISYAQAPMRGGANYGEHDGEVTFHLVAKEESPLRERGLYSVLQECPAPKDGLAAQVLSLIQEEKGSEWFDADEKIVKTVRYGDIAVLVRKRSGDAEKIVAALSEENIPVTTAASVNVCDFWEARLLIDWLSYLDDPEQDIPFAGALLSRVGGFCDGELAQIRLRFPSPYTFRGACKLYVEKMEDKISAKLREFASKTEYFRALMRVRTAAEMMAFLLSEGLESEIAAKRGGEARLRRVRRLFAEADCSTGDFLRRIRSSGRVEYSESGGEDAVKVLTMHASKGLEFPVVILASMDAPFHKERDEVLYTEEFGIAPKSYDRENRMVYETVLRRASLYKMEQEEIKEELNLLYVAMTRAKYRLRVCFCDVSSQALSPRFAKKFSDFIDFSLCGDYFRERNGGEKQLSLHSPLPYIPDKELLEEIRSVRAFRYPYEGSVILPVKSSATELMRGEEKEARTGRRGASVEEGLAYHAFLEKVRFGESAEGELVRMREDKVLSEEQLALLDAEKLKKILALPALKSLAGKKILREQTFLVSLPAREIPSLSTSEDEIVLQGALDLLCEEENGYLILDYKYSSHEAARLKEDYAPQLAIYKRAVEKITGARLVRAKIVNIKELYEVDM